MNSLESESAGVPVEKHTRAACQRERIYAPCVGKPHPLSVYLVGALDGRLHPEEHKAEHEPHERDDEAGHRRGGDLLANPRHLHELLRHLQKR